jgi:hypothetical protein
VLHVEKILTLKKGGAQQKLLLLDSDFPFRHYPDRFLRVFQP